MSRSHYSEDGEQWDFIRWRGAVASAIRGKRGQAFLKEMLAAMDALPEPRLISDELQDPYDGAVCALGAVGKARGLDMGRVDADDIESVAALFGIPHALAAEIVYLNDEEFSLRFADAAERFRRMRRWIENLIADGKGE